MPSALARRIVGQRPQGAMHGGHGQPGPGVEGARALARAAPADEVPLAGQDDPHDELAGLAGDGLLRGRARFSGVRAPRGLADQLPTATARRAQVSARVRVAWRSSPGSSIVSSVAASSAVAQSPPAIVLFAASAASSSSPSTASSSSSPPRLPHPRPPHRPSGSCPSSSPAGRPAPCRPSPRGARAAAPAGCRRRGRRRGRRAGAVFSSKSSRPS